MRNTSHEQNKKKNIQDTLLLLFAMMSVMLMLGWLLGGFDGIVFALLVSVIFMFINHYRNSSSFLKFLQARPISPHLYPELYNVLHRISMRAELSSLPRLYYIPSKMMNAFVTGREQDASIVLTDSLLRNLNTREIAGILGHEVAHIKNGDSIVMGLADTLFRLVYLFSFVFQLLILLSVPVLLYTDISIKIFPVLLITLAPLLCMTLLLALSRTREYEADRMGVKLAGDVYGLISALEKLERYHKGLLSRLFVMPWKISQLVMFRTHPPTSKRIDRLLSLVDSNNRFSESIWPIKVPKRNTYYL